MAKGSNSREKHLESSLERLVEVSEAFSQVATSEINHQAIADAYRDISGARFVAFNLYDDAGTHFTTVAVSGLSKYFDKITSLLGFDLRGRSWLHDPVRHEKIQAQLLTRFENMIELSGNIIPSFIIERIEQLFSLGEVFLMCIMHGERMVGDFTFVMPAGVPFKERKATAIFSRQIELLLAQRQAERRLLLQSEVLQHALDHQRVLSNIAMGLNSLDDFDQRINNCLQIIGAHTGVSRVYIFEHSGAYTSNTYEWCNEGIGTEIAGLQNLALSSLGTIDLSLRENGMLYVRDIAELDAEARAPLEAQNILSVLLFALYKKDALIGFIGFDACDAYRNWNDSELEMLRTVSGIISHAYERRFMESTIEEERDKARQASQAKSEFLANMSHEIRTPMNAILGFSEALHSRLQEPDSKKMVTSILSGGKLLLSLLNDILDLSKIEAGKLELFIQPVSPTAILEETRMLFFERARKKGLHFIVEIADGMPLSLDMDETRVKQIIFNLISNAIKFTHAGHVRLLARFAEHPGSRHGNFYIEVEDTGIGIPEDLADHIFEDFNQLSPENTRKYEGTGLGLSICKRLVEKMQGHIDVRSKVGKGSSFNVIIPGIPISTEADISIHNPDLTGLEFNKSLVLVIDDVLADIEIIESLLISLGLETIHALGGRQAMEALNKKRPDLILLDTRMPEMNGYEFLQTIKDDVSFRDIPVLAYSATIPGYSNNPLARHFSGHIQKPVRRHVLIHELGRHLPYTLENAAGNTNIKAALEPLTNEEAPEHCQEVLKQLEEYFLPQWKRVKDQLVIFRIEDFAGQLEAFADKHRFDYLLQYARKLLHESNTLDIESIKESISLFPYLCKQVETICKKRS